VAALAVPLADRTLLTGLWKGDAAQPLTAELPASDSLEQFLSSHVGASAWPEGAQSYLEAPVTIDGHALCTLGVADAVPRDWDVRDTQILDDAAAAVAAEIRLRLANEQALRFHELVASQHCVHELIAEGLPSRRYWSSSWRGSSATTPP
jgi:GAF domain-containing protein